MVLKGQESYSLQARGIYGECYKFILLQVYSFTISVAITVNASLR